MNLFSIVFISGVILVTTSGDSIRVEPGKQLPQSLTIRTSAKVDGGDTTLRYLLFTPRGYRAEGTKWPLMLFLHGLGECGRDDLPRVKIHGPANIVDSRPDFPFIVLTPQLEPPAGYDPNAKYTSEQIVAMVRKAWKPEELIQLIDNATSQLNIDRDRVYVTGLSMGGFGAWRLIATYPDRFAAAVPICAGGEPEKMAKAASRVPIWAFHGAKDPIVPLELGQKMVDAVKQAGGDVRFTVYPEATHNSWKETYDNPAVYDWLLSHRLKPR